MARSFPSCRSRVGRSRGRSSVGRAPASQAGCRGFETHRPLSGKAYAKAASACPVGVTAVARELGISAARVRRLIEHGPLHAFRHGASFLIEPKRLAQFKRRPDFSQLVAA